tara:strand:+ start:147 stop:509 length:363 start_codon:yes stop_codon:yes gene_type:complete
MSKETWNKYIQEIQELNQESNKISDQIDKEFEFKRSVEEFHKVKQSDLPIFKKYNGFSMVWHYRLNVINGFLTCQKISIENKGIHEIINLPPESIFDQENVDSTKEEWHNAVCKVLKSID